MEIVRGQGEGERSRTFADAFQRDPEFFEFYRSMAAYMARLWIVRGQQWCCRRNSEFLRYFRDPGGAALAGTAPGATPAPPPANGNTTGQ